MKPRQTVKNYHNSSAPPYQAQNVGSSSQPLVGSGPSAALAALRDLDLSKLGLSLDDLSNLQAMTSKLSNPEDIMKYLQTFYNKAAPGSSGAAQMSQPTDWPMQSISPPNWMTGATGSNFNIGNGKIMNDTNKFLEDNNINSSNYNNNNIYNYNYNTPNTGQSQNQDLHFNTNHQQLNSHQTPSNVCNFRVSNSNIHSPQQHLQQKSVLSIHQQQQHHHQHNDPTNRRLSHHHVSTTNASSQSSFTNLSDASNASINISNNNNSTLDTSNLNSISAAMAKTGGTSAHTSNLKDALGSIDSMIYDTNSLMANKTSSSSNQHQHLQKLLTATGNIKQSTSNSNSSPSSSGSSTTNLTHRNHNEPPQPTQQRNITANTAILQSHLSTPAISPPHFSTVPKSLLNLAACTSSSPSTSYASSLQPSNKFSSMVSQLSMMSSRAGPNGHQANASSTSNSRSSSSRADTGSLVNDHLDYDMKSSSNGADNNNSILQQMVRSSIVSNPNSGSSRSSSKHLQRLLSDDQFNYSSSIVQKNSCNVNNNPASLINRQPSHLSNQRTGMSSTESLLACIQERAARAGVNLGEIVKGPQSQVSGQSGGLQQRAPALEQQASLLISPKQNKDDISDMVDRKEIESALSRVEARNDLSLLYPPVLLASNSQKQINALSAGLEMKEGPEVFTDEIKKIVLEQCNIIYECRECNNLFRSLANLVKHKRTYCQDNNQSRLNVSVNKRSHTNPSLIGEQSSITISGSSNSVYSQQRESQQTCYLDPKEQESSGQSILDHSSRNNRSSDLYPISRNRSKNRSNLSNMIRNMQNQEKLNQEISLIKMQNNNSNSNFQCTSSQQTNLSRLLQSQPKSRLPDQALINALTMTPTNHQTVESSFNSAIPCDKSSSSISATGSNGQSSDDVNEQLVCNSSLAKTLLSEKVKSVVQGHQQQQNMRQSLPELAKFDAAHLRSSSSSSGPRVPAPKRKFLEDCIKKVKRDKLQPQCDDDDDQNDDDEDEDADAHAQASADVDSDAHVSADGDVHAHDEVDTEADTDANVNADGNTDAEAEADATAEADGDADPDPDAEADAYADAGASVEADDDGELDAEVDEGEGDCDGDGDDEDEEDDDDDDRGEDNDHDSDNDNDHDSENDNDYEVDNDDDSDNDNDNEDEIVDNRAESSVMPRKSSTTNPKQISPTHHHTSATNSNKPANHEQQASTSSGSVSGGASGGGGGIMKLKIQLKARPDEKSKVYEIV